MASKPDLRWLTMPQRLLHGDWYHAEHLHLLAGGREFFPALIAAIDKAAGEVLLETYIYIEDETGRQISQALCRAARRGVQVRLVTDWVGSDAIAFAEGLRQAGVMHAEFNPAWFGRHGVTRTHRKLAVIDSQIAFVGGLNIIDDYDDGEGGRLPAPRWDFAIRAEGAVVQEVRTAFLHQWRGITDTALARSVERTQQWLRWMVREGGVVAARLHARSRGPIIAFIARDNLHHRRSIENSYLRAIGQAKREVWLANPYFVPGRRLRRALTQAAQRGVQVTLLLGKKEFWLLDRAVPSLYGALLRAGVRIAEYKEGHLHGKVAVVDDRWATVGSSNCDALSLFVNHEANFMVQNHPLVAMLKAHIHQAVHDEAESVDPMEFAHRSPLDRLGNWCAYVLYRLVMRVLTVGQYR